MLPFLIGFVVLAVGAASALYTTKTAPVAAPPAPPAPVAVEPNAILSRLIKAGAKPSWGLVVPEKWAVKV
jgi:hypothetical protein